MTALLSMLSNRKTVYIAAFFCFVLGFLAITLQTNLDRRADITNLLLPVYNLATVGILLLAAWKSRTISPSVSTGWLLLGTAQLSSFSAELSYSIRESLLGEAAYLPSITDFFYLLSYPLFLVGLLYFPAKFRSNLDRLKAVLQIIIVMMASYLILWNFLIGPIRELSEGMDTLFTVITLAYPLCDLLLVLAVLLLIFRYYERTTLVPVALLAISTVFFLAGDLIYTSLGLQELYTTGSAPDLFYLGSYLMMFLQRRQAVFHAVRPDRRLGGGVDLPGDRLSGTDPGGERLAERAPEPGK